MKIAITGSRGLIGRQATKLLNARGHSLVRLVRQEITDQNEIFWNPDAGTIDSTKLEGIDALIHLAGENVASGRWTESKKAEIRQSRVTGTKLIAEAISQLKTPPKTFIAASAIGFYGNRGEETLTEKSPAGSGFLAEVCQEWEATCQSAANAGIRVCNLRFGVVLSTEGGALAKMLPPFLIGAGGPIGSGKQYMSWVAIDDVAQIILHALVTESLSGPLNVVAPKPVTNADFSTALGKVLHRPAFMPLPDFAARLMFGQMADELLLASAKVEPQKLQESGYKFIYPEIQAALAHVLKKA
jgi:uncharacterized protein (TIGR01777 family)